MTQVFSKTIGIKDPEIKKITCPEKVAEHIAEQIRSDKMVVELCCGVGVISVAIAKTAEKVYGVDNNSLMIKSAILNAKARKVSTKTKFILGDVLDANLLKTIKADVAILDPHWHAKKDKIATNIDETHPSLRKMFNLTQQQITNNIIIKIPKEFDFNTLKDLGMCIIENIWWDEEIKFKLAYFSNSIKKNQTRNAYF